MEEQELNTYTWWNRNTDEQVEVEAGGFEEASNIMFGDLGNGSEPYDYNEWELLMVNGRY